MTDPHPFRAAVEAEDWAAVADLLHPDVQFRSPAVHKGYEGREACLHLLGHVKQVFRDFRYAAELAGEDERGRRTAGLVFRAGVADPDGRVREVEGWDLLTHDADGRITEFAVMVRPLSGLIALAQAMGARLEADPVPAAGSAGGGGR